MPRARTQSGRNPPRPAHRRRSTPAAALPLGEVELIGAYLGPFAFGPPAVLVDGHSAHVLMSRPSRLALRVPDEASTGLVEVRNPSGASNAAPLRMARQLSDELHPVTSPAVSRSGMIYATISGPRGKQTPVSIVRISPDGRGTPFVTGILNATGLAFNPDGDLFVTSRAEGNVYRIDASGESTVYAEGMGVATGAAFDARRQPLRRRPQRHHLQDRSPAPDLRPRHARAQRLGLSPRRRRRRQPLRHRPHALLQRRHLGHRSARRNPRLVSRPRPSAGSGALGSDGDVYVAACLHGRRGLVRVTPKGEASLVLAGANLVGVAFSPLGTTILATNEAVYDVDLGVEGLTLF